MPCLPMSSHSKPSRRVCAIVLACVTLASAATAHAQVNAATVREAVTNMSSGDRDKVVTGRNNLLTLLNQVRTNPALLGTFSAQIGEALMPVASGNDPHAKLNAAIVVQRVADQSGAASLADITAKLISDSSPAVSAYGLRASANVLPRLLIDEKLAANNPVVPAIVAAVQTHADSEAVASEAYIAMVRVLNERTAGETLTPAGVTAATPRAVDAVHKLIAARLGQFGKGALAEPAAEQPAISFLGKTSTWSVSTPAQRNQSVRLLLQLMQAGAGEMAQVPAGGNSRLRLEALRNLVKQSAQALNVMTQPTLGNKPALTPSAQSVATLGLATPIAEYRAKIDQVVADFAAGWPEAAATQPATAPAAGATAATPPAPGAATPPAR